jgi:ribosomal protein L37AE/L43A
MEVECPSCRGCGTVRYSDGVIVCSWCGGQGGVTPARFREWFYSPSLSDFVGSTGAVIPPPECVEPECQHLGVRRDGEVLIWLCETVVCRRMM